MGVSRPAPPIRTDSGGLVRRGVVRFQLGEALGRYLGHFRLLHRVRVVDVADGLGSDGPLSRVLLGDAEVHLQRVFDQFLESLTLATEVDRVALHRGTPPLDGYPARMETLGRLIFGPPERRLRWGWVVFPRIIVGIGLVAVSGFATNNSTIGGWAYLFMLLAFSITLVSAIPMFTSLGSRGDDGIGGDGDDDDRDGGD